MVGLARPPPADALHPFTSLAISYPARLRTMLHKPGRAEWPSEPRRAVGPHRLATTRPFMPAPAHISVCTLPSLWVPTRAAVSLHGTKVSLHGTKVLLHGTKVCRPHMHFGLSTAEGLCQGLVAEGSRLPQMLRCSLPQGHHCHTCLTVLDERNKKSVQTQILFHCLLRGRFRTARAQRGHSANYSVDYPGNTPQNHPPTEACRINSKQHGGCTIQDPGTRGNHQTKTSLVYQQGL